jgi:signal transduction histidine kinase/ActR/RegA family two-component response regulator
MIIFGMMLVWTNVFVYAHKINMLSVQIVFMILLSSFYVLGTRQGIIYTTLSILPIISFLFYAGNLDISTGGSFQELASPGFEIIVVLNFISIAVAHYLFYRAFINNLKEKETLNLKLQSSIAEAHQLATSRSNFLSTMSHELRTPLNSVIGITELLLEDNPEERQKENLKVLQLSSGDLLSLINNILDFNKIDSDKLVLENVNFRLGEFMKNTCLGLRLKASDKKLDFILDIDPQLEHAIVASDPTRLAQLLYNLAGNAIKFTDKGSITIKLECIRKAGHEIDVLFSVKDTGIGIHPDKHGLIFESFTQAESHTTRKYGGTGLGLAIVKQILALFSSALHLESTPGNGACFSFTLSFTTTVEAADAGSPALQERSDLSYLKLLVAEDNDVNRLLIKKQLEKLSINAVIVENGKLAYEAYLSGDYDAVLMDLHMPVLDGYAAVKQIRTLTDPAKAQVHIIAFTASVNEQQQIHDAGFNDYLYKPLNIKELYDKLEKIMTHNRLPTA